MEIPRQFITLWGVMVVLWNPVARAIEPPLPTPTPRPGTLAALAGRTALHRAPGVGTTDPIVITDDNLVALADGAVVTLVTSNAAELPDLPIKTGVDPKTRARWRKKVLAQSKVIAGLEDRRDDVEAEIDRLGRGKIDSRTLDRIAKAKIKLGAVDGEIKSKNAEFSRIIRAARKDGAQPGWFR